MRHIRKHDSPCRFLPEQGAGGYLRPAASSIRSSWFGRASGPHSAGVRITDRTAIQKPRVLAHHRGLCAVQTFRSMEKRECGARRKQLAECTENLSQLLCDLRVCHAAQPNCLPQPMKIRTIRSSRTGGMLCVFTHCSVLSIPPDADRGCSITKSDQDDPDLGSNRVVQFGPSKTKTIERNFPRIKAPHPNFPRRQDSRMSDPIKTKTINRSNQTDQDQSNRT